MSTQLQLAKVLPISNKGPNNAMTVNARDLYDALYDGVANKTRFDDWVKRKLADGGYFTEGQDFLVFLNSDQNPLGGRPAVEYALTTDTAKHLAMMTKTKNAHGVRQYFIEIERRYYEGRNAPVPKTVEEILLQGMQMIHAETKVIKADLAVTQAQVVDLKEFQNEAKSGPLNANQIQSLLQLVRDRYAELGIRVVVGKRNKKDSIRFILAALKRKFLPKIDQNMVTFKNIASSDFQAACEFIKTWEPTKEAKQWLTIEGALRPEGVA